MLNQTTGDANKKSFIEQIFLFVNTEDNTMGTTYTFLVSALPSLKMEVQLSTDNLLKRGWFIAEPDSESRAYKEPKMVPDMCFLPGTSRFLKATLAFSF